MEPNGKLSGSTEFGPIHLIPPLIVGVVVFFTTFFGSVFVILPLAVEEQPSWLLACGGVAGALLALLSWWRALRTWQLEDDWQVAV